MWCHSRGKSEKSTVRRVPGGHGMSGVVGRVEVVGVGGAHERCLR